MPLFKNIKENNCLISIWRLSESLDYLKKKINSGDIKKITNISCEISTWNNKIVIRCLANDNYDLKKTLNYILENIIHDKVPSSWYL